MSSILNRFKRFLIDHSRLVDFLSASLIICFCLIILLPKVHDSFQTNTSHQHPQDETSSTDGFTHPNPLLINTSDQAHSNDHNHNHSHAHQHSHELPLGEVIICAGFFVFYCIGLGLDESNESENASLLVHERKTSNVCCSSTRCPSSLRENVLETSDGDIKCKSQEETPEGAPINSPDDDCMFTLNRHHTHHTHIHHHEHQQQQQQHHHHHHHSHPHQQSLATTTNIRKRDDYGSISKMTPVEPDNNPIYVEEITITRRVLNGGDGGSFSLSWPLSIRVTLFCIILSTALVTFDMNIHGLIETIKVFRAAATGALLYVAFFLVLPRNEAGCNSCVEEEIV